MITAQGVKYLLSEWLIKQQTPDALAWDIIDLVTAHKVHGKVEHQHMQQYAAPIQDQLEIGWDHFM